jgi:hypothetical protein
MPKVERDLPPSFRDYGTTEDAYVRGYREIADQRELALLSPDP